MGKVLVLKAKRLVTPNTVVADGVVVIKDGRIYNVGAQSTTPVPENAEVVDYGDSIIAPGLMDIHCHGFVEGQCGDDAEIALKMAAFMLRGGATSFLPTGGNLQKAKNIAKARRIQKEQGLAGAEMVGIHMEGPFLEPKNVKGVDTGDADAPEPNLELLEEILEAGEGGIRIMGLGILRPNADKVVRRLRELGIVASIAHTKANANQFAQAVELGYNHGTHLYNVMTGLHHRRPGVVGGLLTHDGMTTELICDFLHVHPWAIDIAIRCKGPDRIAIITDLTIAGLKDGEYPTSVFGNIPITVINGVARIKGAREDQDNTLAGSSMLINVGVRNVHSLGYPLPVAFRMGALTPARIVGLDKTKGSLEITKDADIIIVDDDINVKAAYVRGELLYEAQ